MPKPQGASGRKVDSMTETVSFHSKCLTSLISRMRRAGATPSELCNQGLDIISIINGLDRKDPWRVADKRLTFSSFPVAGTLIS